MVYNQPVAVKVERVEYYAGGSGEEKPRAVFLEGKRMLVIKILSEKRLLVPSTGQRKELYECLLENGQVVKIERES